MGAVYEAQRPDLPRSVALKVLLAPEDPELVARFGREVEACGRLSHPNLVGVHDSGVSGECCYLVMELVRGDSLQALLDRDGPCDPATAEARVIEAAAGIAHAHAAGVLHRDLKPSNLLWDQELSRVRVVDFGLTGRLSKADSLTVTGEVLGTPGYLAPEQIGGGSQSTGPATDVYGLGATLFALLTGRPPFVGKGLSGLADVAHEPAPDVRSLCPEVDAALAAIVACCLEKDPAQRYSTVSVLQDALKRRHAGSWRRWRRFALGGVLFALIAGVVWLGATNLAEQVLINDYDEWRAKSLKGYSLGRGDPPVGLAERLAEWSRDLEGVTFQRQSPRWADAVVQVRAERRLLLARGGHDPGPPAVDSFPPRRGEDWLVEALIDLEAGRFGPARGAFRRVQGRALASEAFRLGELTLLAKWDPAAFMERLAHAKGGELALVQGLFPTALLSAAPDLPKEDLLEWIAVATKQECKVASVFREALEVSDSRRRAELKALRPGDEADYLEDLAQPIRSAGLWPGPLFVRACRERLGELSRIRSTGDRCRLVAFEHQLFYRVEPKPCLLPAFLNRLVPLGEGESVQPSPLLTRTRLRYGLHLPGVADFGLRQKDLDVLIETTEKESRLESALRWILGRRKLSSRVMDASDYDLAQREVETLLTTGIDDLHPTVADVLIRALLSFWVDEGAHPHESRPDLAAKAEVLAYGEFERSLRWYQDQPYVRFKGVLHHCASLSADPWLHSNRPQAGFARYEIALEQIRAIQAAAEPGLRRSLESIEAGLYGRVGSSSLLFSQEGGAVKLLRRGRERVHESGSPRAKTLFWGGLLAGYLALGQQEEALERVNSLLEPGEPLDPFLAIQVSRVLVVAREFERSRACLDRSEEVVPEGRSDLEKGDRERALDLLEKQRRKVEAARNSDR